MRGIGPGGWVGIGACGLVVACSLQDLDYLRDESILTPDAGQGGTIGTSGSGGASGSAGAQGGNSGAGGTSGSGGGTAGAGGSGTGGASSSGTGGASSGSGGSGASGGSGGSGASGGVGGAAGFVGSTGDAGPDTNIVQDPGFEAGLTGWVGFGSAVLIWESNGPLAGARCLHATQRDADWKGPSYSLLSSYTPGATYHVSAWVRTESPVSSFKITVRYTCSGQPPTFYDFMPLQTGFNYWTLYEGTFVAPAVECAPTNLDIYLESAPAGEDLYVDEFRVELEAP